MANVLIESQTMTDIADAIREKNGSTDTYKPSEMPQAVRDIKSETDDSYYCVNPYQTGVNGLFSRSHLPDEFTFDFSKITPTNFGGIFYGYSYADGGYLKVLNLIGDMSKVTYFYQAFSLRVNLVTINGILDLSAVNTAAGVQMFDNNHALENVTFTPNCIKYNFSIRHSNKLTNESIQSIIDGLADLTGQTVQTITFHPEVKNKLTEEQIASATSKNWNIA